MSRQKNKSIKSYAILGLMVAPAIVSGMVLSSTFVSANDSVVDTVTAIVPVSCTMHSSGTSSHSATIPSGTYTPDIGTTTMNVICNDNAGFSIYAAGFTGETTIGINSNKLVGTAASGNATIDTGTATGPGSTDTSNWAMKLEADPYQEYPITILDDYDYYHEVPSAYTKVATRLTGTDSGTGATGATLTSTYAAYISKSQPADTYSGQVKFILIHPNNEPLPANRTFDRAYLDAGKSKYKGYYKMQDMDFRICLNVDEYETTTLIDVRDDNTYTVARIDNACWMTQNLRITGTISADESNFTGNDFNVSAYDLKTDGTSGGACDDANGLNNPCSHAPDSSDLSQTGLTVEQLGVWYNYAAATAGEIKGDSDATATQDICPAGWFLPDGDPNSWQDESLNILIGQEAAFLPVYGGTYHDALLEKTDYGQWWSNNASNSSSRRYLLYNNGNLSINQGGASAGNSVRCVSV